jgi:hypothetical protein
MYMTVPTIDLSAIFWGAVIEFIIETIIFLAFKIRGVTLAVNVILSFVIPFLGMWLYINSKPPIEQQILAIADYAVSAMVGLVVFVLSAVFSYIIGSIAYMLSGGRTEQPEF